MNIRWLKISCVTVEEINGIWDLDLDDFCVTRAKRAGYICYHQLDGYVDDEVMNIVQMFADNDRLLTLEVMTVDGDKVLIQKSKNGI